MIFRRHPTRETLMEMAGNRLPADARRRVESHVASCVACGQKLEEMRVTCAVFENLSEAGLSEVMWLSQQGSTLQATKSPWWQGKVAVAGGSALAALCAAGLLIFVVPQTRVQAKANALLNESIKALPENGPAPHYRMNVGATPCPRVHKLAHKALSDSLCSAATKRLQQTAWESGSPLSAKAFQSWRANQAHPRDRVTQVPLGWKIETTSDEGAVQQATLELRSSDHRVAQLVLQFRDVAEDAKFVEDDEPVTAAATIASVQGAKQAVTAGDDPADVLEVHAWSALHDAQVDSVWDASVVRHEQDVHVNVAADDTNKRQQVLHAFAGASNQNAHVQTTSGSLRDMPKRAFSGDGPALAEHWVTEHYPDSTRQTAFKSEATRLSREVLGRALWIDRMESRRSALQSCSCSAVFNGLIAEEQRDLARAEMRLTLALQPLAGRNDSPKPLSGSDARKLDLSVQELFISSNRGAEEDGMQRQLASVQKLLQISAK